MSSYTASVNEICDIESEHCTTTSLSRSCRLTTAGMLRQNYEADNGRMFFATLPPIRGRHRLSISAVFVSESVIVPTDGSATALQLYCRQVLCSEKIKASDEMRPSQNVGDFHRLVTVWGGVGAASG
ncbi:hypothetical protein J6590_014257 [Homalodisca vitripennis]|nr:hypothetical protein J6590_014257 [Homalodisca vitripennis]